MYAASIMFGYFVRRVDKRFQLERSLGLLPQNQEEAVARLERLFSQVNHPRTIAHALTFSEQDHFPEDAGASAPCTNVNNLIMSGLAGGGSGWSR